MKRRADREQQHAGHQRDQRGDQRDRHRGRRAEDDGEDDDRERDADELPDGSLDLLGLVDDLTATRDVETGVLGGRDRLLESLARLLAELVGGLVVLDGRERDLPVLRDLPLRVERIHDGGHVVLLGDGREDCVDRVAALAVLDGARSRPRRRPSPCRPPRRGSAARADPGPAGTRCRASRTRPRTSPSRAPRRRRARRVPR